MKISYNWLIQFIDTDKRPAEISQLLTDIGLEVESLEEVQSVPGGLEGLVIGEVKNCIRHPNADRLKITQVLVGAENELQIVCGAPNVTAGQKVVVAIPGTTVFPLEGEPFKINRSKIRGEVSEGMICAEDEIGIGKSHDGIIVLDASAVPGTLAKDWFGLTGDFLFEIGLTPNRADAASHLGVARDLAACLRVPFQLPDISSFAVAGHERTIPVVVENDSSCHRYSSLTIEGCTVAASPAWLKDQLGVIGIRPINNIVDVTNYVLHELGQPLHAFDADKIAGGKIVVRNCIDDTPFITLDGVSRTLSAEDLMICDAEKPLCIAGVFGGLDSGVSPSTTSIFLESAWFDAVAVRKTAKRHTLKTDASFRFERGTDPDMTVIALKRAALLILEVAGGRIASEIGDFYPHPKPFTTIALSFKNVARLIGKQIPNQEIVSILTASGIRVIAETADGLMISVPPYKVDVTREVDVIEEILRLYGYNRIEIPTQVRASLNYSAKPDPELCRNQAADLLSANGFYEILTNSLTSSQFLVDESNGVTILNPLSNELNVMRQTLLFSGLEVISFNQKRKSPDLKLYEFGKTYRKNEPGFAESSRLSLFITGGKNKEQWNSPAAPVTFFNLKATVDVLLKKFNISNISCVEKNDDEFGYGLQYLKGEKILVAMGTVAKEVLRKMDISGEVFYADLNWDLLLKIIRSNKITFREIPKYPAVKRDLSLLVERTVKFADLERVARRTEKKLLREVSIFDVYEGKNIADNKKSYALSFTLQDEEQTLTEMQIDAVMQKLIANFEKEAGAEVRNSKTVD